MFPSSAGVRARLCFVASFFFLGIGRYLLDLTYHLLIVISPPILHLVPLSPERDNLVSSS